MNILSVLCLFFLIFDIVIIVYIIAIGARKKIHALFIIMLVCYAFWNFTGILLYSAETRETFLLVTIPASFFIFSLPLTLHFVLEFCSAPLRIKLPLLGIFYGLSVMLCVFSMQRELLFNDFVKKDGFWHFLPAPFGILQIVFLLFCVSSFILPMLFLLAWKKHARYKREKSQVNILIGSLGAIIGLFLFEYFIMVKLDYNVQASAIYANLWTLGIWVSILKYRFMTITPDKISKLVIEGVDEALLVIETDGTVLFTNAAARKLLKQSREITGLPLADYFPAPADIGETIAQVAGGLKTPLTLRVDLTAGDGTTVPLDLEMRLITDKAGDGLGILLLGREVRELKQFKSIFHVTEREVEVIRAVLSGESSKAIAVLLGIAERTVKSHVEHIYVKLNVKNRVQLFSLVKEYNLFPPASAVMQPPGRKGRPVN